MLLHVGEVLAPTEGAFAGIMERPVHETRRRQPDDRLSAGRAAFTLVELLISISIVAVLVAILLPALRFSIKAARSFRCQVALRGVAFDFTVFADDALHGDRGNDPRDLHNARRFRLETFQESQYGLDEFWRWETAATHTLPDAQNNDPMRCAEVRGEITLHSNTPCSQGAITPAANVSFGFNMRMSRPEVPGPGGAPIQVPVTLDSSILLHGRAPLAWDIDGAVAAARNLSPVFSAPSLNSTGPYANSRYWFPAFRHNGAINVAFIDGSVMSSARPLEQTGWDWAYQPPR
jgi:prepilin-type N-terminal cleavage/methylation domain-containing protein/prepilin-type processing-associated H-X9-DG protein